MCPESCQLPRAEKPTFPSSMILNKAHPLENANTLSFIENVMLLTMVQRLVNLILVGAFLIGHPKNKLTVASHHAQGNNKPLPY